MVKKLGNPSTLGQIGDSDLRQLKIFKVVVDCAGFTQAAAELNVTRSAISSSMADLEARLGLKLCNRGRSGFSLTDSGRKIYKYTNDLLACVNEFRLKVNLIHASLTGELNVGVVNNLISCPKMRIVNSLRKFKNEAPMVKINFVTMPPNEVERRVLGGELDIGIVPQRKEISGLHQHKMYGEKVGLYCGELHPLYALNDSDISDSMLREYDMVAPNYSIVKSAEELYRDFKVTAEVSDGESIAFLLMTGCFIGFLPINYARQWVEKGQFRQVLANKYEHKKTYVALSSAGQSRDPVVELYLECLTTDAERVGA